MKGSESQASLWELDAITKIFPGVRAVDGVRLVIRAGQIHGLVGENGSGKSTLVKCLSGVHQPSAGRILHCGSPVVIHDPFTARSLGVGTIYQELSLVETMSVAENIFLGRLPRRVCGIFVDWGSMRTAAETLLARLGIEIDPDATVAELSVAERQMVEIAKALSLEASLLIMDEPTAALGTEEVARLHGLVRNLAREGRAVVYISHRLDEVMELVEQVTIMKDGRVVGSDSVANLDLRTVVRLMIGEELKAHFPKERNATTEPLLSVRGLRSEGGVRDASFVLHRGEVLGLAGVIGTGRTSIAQAIFGVDRITGGSMQMHFGSRTERLRGGSTEAAISHGIALLTENRKTSGLFFNFTGVPNTSIAKLGRISRFGVMNLEREAKLVDTYITKLRITSGAREKSVQFLSGGNQQKVIIARWLFSQAEVFILDEPTQGIDIGAKVEVYNLINELTRMRKGLILISSDFDELLAMSDRIAIVNNGRVIEVRQAGDFEKNYLVEKVFVHQAG